MNSGLASKKMVEKWLSESTDLALNIILLIYIGRQNYEI